MALEAKNVQDDCIVHYLAEWKWWHVLLISKNWMVILLNIIALLCDVAGEPPSQLCDMIYLYLMHAHLYSFIERL